METSNKIRTRKSVFNELGFNTTVDLLIQEIQFLYVADEIPWVVGYSGGKDSTAVVQLVWLALLGLENIKRNKNVHIISTNTLVENPVVASWVDDSLKSMAEAAEASALPIVTHRLTPRTEYSFWVNLIGRGYPAPRPKFRWCTARLKISPSNDFINNLVRDTGEALLILGTRKAESAARAKAMKRLETTRTRERISQNASLPNSLVYTPIEDWTNDDVWLFLMQASNPWNFDNRALLTLYQGASEGGECPLVVDTSSPSCGDSRFGCWVCTLVDKDKSMAAMIQNDEEKEWMLPLLELRDELDVPDDRHLRDFRRMSGKVQIFHDRPIPGPYKQEVREHWLRKLLQANLWMKQYAPATIRDVELITLDELREIRRIWVTEKHEFEDSLPRIYREVTGEPFDNDCLDDDRTFSAEEMLLLKEATGNDSILYELIRDLIDVEKNYRKMEKRSGLFGALEQVFRRHFYADEEDATDRALRLHKALDEAREGRYKQLSLFEESQGLGVEDRHDP